MNVMEAWGLKRPTDGGFEYIFVDPENPDDTAYLLRRIRYLLARRHPGNRVPVQITGIEIEGAP